MKLVSACLTASLFAASFGMPVHFSAKDCGASSGHYQSSAVVPARPKTGEVFKVTNHFSFDEDITGGSFDVKVHALGGIQLKHATGPLCGSDTSYDVYLALVKVASVTIYGSQCPLAKGPASIKYDIKLSPILPASTLQPKIRKEQISYACRQTWQLISKITMRPRMPRLQ
jgi:hypothetical protein